MCLNNRAIFLSSPGTVLGIVYLEHDFNFNSWTISNKIKHHLVRESFHNAKTALNKYFKWSQSSTPPTPPQLLAPQSGALRISAYGDFQSHPIPTQPIHPLIAFEHLSLSMVIRNNASGPKQINVD